MVSTLKLCNAALALCALPCAFDSDAKDSVDRLTVAPPAAPYVSVASPRVTKGPLFGHSVYNPQPCTVRESGFVDP